MQSDALCVHDWAAEELLDLKLPGHEAQMLRLDEAWV